MEGIQRDDIKFLISKFFFGRRKQHKRKF